MRAIIAALLMVSAAHADSMLGNDPNYFANTEICMPAKNVMPKFKRGQLHSGSKKGPVVKNKKQAIAIMLSEKRAEKRGKLK